MKAIITLVTRGTKDSEKQMNLYAAQIISEEQLHRLDEWSETNPNEIKRYFALIIWIELVRLHKFHL